MRTLVLGLVPCALAAFFAAGCVTHGRPPPATVRAVDLDRYMGRWFVISHVPSFLEKGKVASFDTYAWRPDGTLTNNFTFREKTLDGPEKTWKGTARIVDAATRATWKVSFIWPVATTYKILALDANYGWAVVSNDDGKLLWVLGRERRLPPETYASILAVLRLRGLPVDELVPVPQPLS